MAVSLVAVALLVDPARSLAEGDFPAPPSAQLLPIEGVADEAAQWPAVQSQVDRMLERALALDDHERAAAWRLAAANLILAEQLEPACTRSFLGIDVAGLREDEIARRRAALDRTDLILDQVRDFLIQRADAGSETGERGDADPRDANPPHERLEKDHALLKAFAGAVRAHVLSVTDTADTGDPRRAASALASALEDSRPQVAAAAAFWQALLRAKEEDPKPGLAALDPVLLDPPRGAMPYAFHARLLRCQILARHEHPSASVALLLRIEDAIDDWITGDMPKAAARRSAALVRFHTLRAWHERVAGGDKSAERAWCAERAASLIAEWFKDDPSFVYRLNPAVPIIAKAPDDAPPHDGAERLNP